MVNKDSEDLYIFGKNSVLESLEAVDHAVEKIFIRESLRRNAIEEILTLASQNTVPVSFVPGRKLYSLVGSVNDQGVVALLGTSTYMELDEWLNGINMDEYPAVLLLDEIEDPHNFGAIIRSAAAFGIAGIIIGKHRQAPVNATVYNTSAGAVAHTPIIRVVNLNQCILELKDLGFWFAGLDAEAESTIYEAPTDRPMGFVIGNEGHGISQKTLEHCDYKLRIPIQPGVESLNASVSSAIICYEWNRQKSEK